MTIPFNYSKVENIQEIAKKEEIIDIQLYRFEKEKLTISGSKDNIYYHSIEITFTHPVHINGPLYFQIDPDKEFIEEIPLKKLACRHVHSESDRPLRAFRFKSSEGDFLDIAAEGFNINTDLVYHYPRDHLKNNERLAYWLNQ